MVRFQRSHWIAFLALGCSSTTAWGQLPSNKISPINQINRSWGFGVSDGYHECPDPEKCRSSIDQKKSWLDKFNPFGSVLYGQSNVVTPRYQATANSPVSAMPMTTLPSAQHSYSQFAAPAETPLPGAHYAPQIPPPLPQPSYPNFPRDNSFLSTPIPDPNASSPAESGNSMPTNPGSQPRSIPQSGPAEDPQRNPNLDLLNENETTELVPPSPPLRRRQPTDKPLGEIPDSWSPPEKMEAKPQPQANPSNDEDLNLLPTNNGLPPVTYDYDYGRPCAPVARNHFESYPQAYPQPNSPAHQPSYQQPYPTQQSYRQTYPQPSRPPVAGSRSLISRDNSNATNPYAALQVQQQPMYTTVQNPYTQYNSNRYR